MSMALYPLIEDLIASIDPYKHERSYSPFNTNYPPQPGNLIRLISNGTIDSTETGYGDSSYNGIHSYYKEPLKAPATAMTGIPLGGDRYLAFSGTTMFVMNLSTNTPVYGSSVTVPTGAYKYIKLSSSLIACFTLAHNGTTDMLGIRILSITGNTISMGTTTSSIETMNTSGGLEACLIDTSALAVMYYEKTGTTPKLVTIAFNPTTFNVSSQGLNSLGTIQTYFGVDSITKVGTNTIVLSYRYSSASTTPKQAQVITFSSIDYSLTGIGSRASITSASSWSDWVHVGSFSPVDGKINFIYAKGTSGSYSTYDMYNHAYTISGTTITPIGETTIYSNNCNLSSIPDKDPFYTSATARYYFVTIGFSLNTSVTTLNILKVPIDGSVPSLGVVDTIAADDDYGVGKYCYNSTSRRITIIINNSSSTGQKFGSWVKTFIWTLDSLTVTAELPLTQTHSRQVPTNTTQYNILSLPNGNALSHCYLSDSTWKSQLLDMTLLTQANTDNATLTSTLIGYLQLNGKVVLKGVADGFTGLTPATKYYTNPIYNVSTTGTTVLGTAISSTEILIKEYMTA